MESKALDTGRIVFLHVFYSLRPPTLISSPWDEMRTNINHGSGKGGIKSDTSFAHCVRPVRLVLDKNIKEDSNSESFPFRFLSVKVG